MAQGYTAELEELIRAELLPIYLRYYRLLNTSPPLGAGQKLLLKELHTEAKVCSLLKDQKIDLAAMLE